MKKNKTCPFAVLLGVVCVGMALGADKGEKPSAGHAHAGGEYTLSHGRQVLLNRGLQVQGLVAFGYTNNFTNASQWRSANFTTFNFGGTIYPSLLTLTPLVGYQWGRVHNGAKYLKNTPLPGWKVSEMHFVDTFVAFQYYDELDGQKGKAKIMDPATLADAAATYREWNRRYPNALAYTNFFGSQLNAAQLSTYMQATQPDMLMFNYVSPGYDSNPPYYAKREQWYAEMQKYRTTALSGFTTAGGGSSGPLPYGQYLNLYRWKYRDPASDLLPSESFVRLQQFASWAFGYTFVEGFIYNGDSKGGVCSVMFSADGDAAATKTPVFDYVAETNRQSRNLGPALVRLVSTDVRLICGRVNGVKKPSVPGISSWRKGHENTGGYRDYITSITPRGKDNARPVATTFSDVLVGYFVPLLSDNSGCTFANGLHFTIVNGAFGTPFAPGTTGAPAADLAEWYHLTFDFTGSDFNSLVRLNRDTGLVELVPLTHISDGSRARYYLDLSLPGGTGDLFAFWNSSNALPTIPEIRFDSSNDHR